jgi:hypothetical protein
MRLHHLALSLDKLASPLDKLGSPLFQRLRERDEFSNVLYNVTLYGTYTSALTFERCLKRFGNCATTIRNAISRQVRSSEGEERLRGSGRERRGYNGGGETERELEREGGIQRGV